MTALVSSAKFDGEHLFGLMVAEARQTR